MVALLTLTNCGEDEEIPKVGFTSGSSNVVEGSSVSVPFSVAIPSGVTPSISFAGTATENIDFTWTISADGRELAFQTLADDTFDDETIILEITGFNGSAQVGQTATHTINISDPGLLIELTWTNRDGGVSDLDLILFRETSPGSDEYTEVDGSFGVGSSESVSLPGNGTNAKYAVGVEYFDGTSDDIDFTLTLSTTAGTINSNTKEIVFTGSLTEYHQTAELSNVTFSKNNFNYSNFSSLFIDTPLNITLSWNAGGGTPGNVDMDLFLSYRNPVSGVFETIDASTSGSSPTETVTLPGNAPNGTYGLRYKYYSGTSNTVSFTATFSTEGGTLSGTTGNTISFNGAYTLANVNPGGSTNISQTFVKNGSSFTNFSTITIPASGSEAPRDGAAVDEKNKESGNSRLKDKSRKKEKGLTTLIRSFNR